MTVGIQLISLTLSSSISMTLFSANLGELDCFDFFIRQPLQVCRMSFKHCQITEGYQKS